METTKGGRLSLAAPQFRQLESYPLSTLEISNTSPEKKHCVEGGVEDEQARRLIVTKNSQLLPESTLLVTNILTYNIFGNYTI